MRTRSLLAAAVLLFTGACAAETPNATAQSTDEPTGEAVEFKDALLRIEINDTDGDAGMQIELDHEPWTSIRITAPDGGVLVDVTNQGALADYGLTELFSESSEPPFDEFPFDEFKELFPEGEYLFEGATIDGERMESRVPFSHDVPGAPKVTSPEEDAEVSADGLVVRWEPVSGVEHYQVIVAADEEGSLRELVADLTPDVTELAVPAVFLEPGLEHKIEVIARAPNENQVITEAAFTVAS